MPKDDPPPDDKGGNGNGGADDVRSAVTLDGQRVDLVRRGGKLVPNYQPYRWTEEISITENLPDEPAPSEGEIQSCQNAHIVSHWDFTTIRSVPGLLARLRRGDHLRETDAWDWEFEGPSDEVTWIQLQFYQVISRFHRKLPERRRERDRWIALHYIARTSPFCVRSARGDEAEGRSPKCLINLADERMAAVLSRDLKIRDEVAVLRVIGDYQEFCEGLSALRGNISRERLHKALGLESKPLPPVG